MFDQANCSPGSAIKKYQRKIVNMTQYFNNFSTMAVQQISKVAIFHAKFSNDSEIVATSLQDGQIQIFRTTTGS